MEDQITVRLPATLSAALRRASRRLRRKNSDVVRMALEAYLLRPGEPVVVRPADRVAKLLGSLDSGKPDLAEHHREYVLESLKRGR